MVNRSHTTLKAKATKPRRTTANVKEPALREPKIEWVKNKDWTWRLVTYLTDHPSFRHKLFSDSTSAANKEDRPKAVAKDGKHQQFATLAKAIFEDDEQEGRFYKAKPVRFATSVETRLQRLKKEYGTHLKTLGQTGAGLDPDMVTPGSDMANVVACITEEWPWWKEFHSFWRELPNYNAVGVTTSVPGVDHAAEAAALFAPDASESGEVDGKVDDDADIDGELAEEDEDRDESEVDYTKAIDATYHQARSVSLLPAVAVVPPPAAAVTKKAPKSTGNGHDSGLQKAQAATAVSCLSTSAGHQSALKNLQSAREEDAQRMKRKREMAHELAMSKENNKRIKYELKYGNKAKAAENNRQARLDELKIQLEIAKYQSMAARNPMTDTQLASGGGRTSNVGTDSRPNTISNHSGFDVMDSMSSFEHLSSPLHFPSSDTS